MDILIKKFFKVLQQSGLRGFQANKTPPMTETFNFIPNTLQQYCNNIFKQKLLFFLLLDHNMQTGSLETEGMENQQLTGVSGFDSGLNIKLAHNTIYEHRQLAKKKKKRSKCKSQGLNLQEQIIRPSWNLYQAASGREKHLAVARWIQKIHKRGSSISETFSSGEKL